MNLSFAEGLAIVETIPTMQHFQTFQAEIRLSERQFDSYLLIQARSQFQEAQQIRLLELMAGDLANFHPLNQTLE
jgi:hypothetical protein